MTPESSQKTRSDKTGSLPRDVWRFRVRGICFVPTEVEMVVDARSEEEAIRIAKASRWQDHIDQQSGDNSAAFDWQPYAEEISSPNVERTREGQ